MGARERGGERRPCRFAGGASSSLVRLATLLGAVLLASSHAAAAVLAAAVAGAGGGDGDGSTIISGMIDEDQTWTPGGGPYVLVGDVRFVNGASLAIEPGTLVLGRQGARLQILGHRSTFRVRGTAAAPVRFEAELPGGSWLGVRCERIRGEASESLPSLIQHAEFRHTDGIALDLWRTDVRVSDVVFSEFVGIGVAADQTQSPPLEVTRCRFIGGTHASEVRGMRLRQGRGSRILDCVFIACRSVGFASALAVQHAEETTVRGCTFTGNGDPDAPQGAATTMEISGDGSLVEDCRFEDNIAEYGGSLRASFSGLITIRRCHFVGNEAMERGGGLYTWGGDLVIDQCEFRHNRAREGGGAYISVDRIVVTDTQFIENRTDWYAGAAGAAFRVRRDRDSLIMGCTFEGNEARLSHGGMLASTGFGTPSPRGVPALRVVDCRIIGNVGGLRGGGAAAGNGVVFERVLLAQNRATSGGGMSLFGSFDAPVLRACLIIDNVAEFGGGITWFGFGGVLAETPMNGEPPTRIVDNHAEFGAAMAMGSPGQVAGAGTVDATAVDWGTDDVAAIRAMVHDTEDDSRLDHVITAPRGGFVVDTDLRWTLAESPIRLRGPVVVTGSSVLEIEAGVTVEMAPGASINVGNDGPSSLRILGRADAPVRFVPEPGPGVPPGAVPPPNHVEWDERGWSGIRIGPEAVDVVWGDDGHPIGGTFLMHAEISGVTGPSGAAVIDIQRTSTALHSVVVRDNAIRGLHATIEIGEALSLLGCTFARNRVVAAPYVSPGPRGGGAWIVGRGQVDIERCTFIGNSVSGSYSSDGGGGLAVVQAGGRLESCSFEGNDGSRGGGAWLFDVLDFVVSDCRFRGVAGGGGDGLAVAGRGEVLIEDCVMLDCGLRSLAVSSSYKPILVRRCTVSGSTNGGWAASFNGDERGPLRVTDCLFEGNQGSVQLGGGVLFDRNRVLGNQGGIGGGVSVLQHDGPPSRVVDCEIRGNSAERGGGIGIILGSLIVRDSRIIANTASERGGAIGTWDGEDVSVDLAGNAIEGWNVLQDNVAPLGSAISIAADLPSRVTAKHVCWGTDDLHEIDDMIDDGMDDEEGNRGVVLLAQPVVGRPCAARTCDGDLDADGRVGLGDLVQVLARFGDCDGCPEDLDADGSVGSGDVAIILAGWGACPD